MIAGRLNLQVFALRDSMTYGSRIGQKKRALEDLETIMCFFELTSGMAGHGYIPTD